MAAQFPGFEPSRLRRMVDSRRKSVLETPPVGWSLEEEFSEGVERNEVIDRAVDDFPKRLKKCIDARGGHFENK